MVLLVNQAEAVQAAENFCWSVCQGLRAVSNMPLMSPF